MKILKIWELWFLKNYMWYSHDFPSLPQRIQSGDSKRHKSTYVHSSQNMETTQVYISRMDKQGVNHTEGYILQLGKGMKFCQALYTDNSWNTVHYNLAENKHYIIHSPGAPRADSNRKYHGGHGAGEGIHSWYWKIPKSFSLERSVSKSRCITKPKSCVISEMYLKMATVGMFTLPQ